MTETSAQGNLPEFTVSELSTALKRTVEDTFSYVRVRGELSGFKRAASGHMYMALKDETAVLDAVCWRGTASRLSIKPEDGLEVICSGRLTTYPARSKYQLVIDSMELAGEGALLKLLEERRKKLAAEGLFDEARKRPLPFLPEVIGVVTSPTGAVIRDILHRLNDRFPRHVLLWPVLVQGEGAAGQVAAAIEGFNTIGPEDGIPRPDVLIVARGGGSLEDLWAFNEEVVVRAAASSEIPLISAVGHETDTTLIDFASDRRAPTPTAAAEMAVPVRAELLATVMDDERRLVAAIHRMLEERRVRLEGLARGLPDLDMLLGTWRQRHDSAVERLDNAIRRLLTERRQQVERWAGQVRPPRQVVDEAKRRLDREADALLRTRDRLLDRPRDRVEQLGSMLESLSFRRVLERGYAVVRDAAAEKPVTAVAALSAGDAVSIEFADGRAGARIEGDAPAPRNPDGGKPRSKGRPKPRGNDDKQGSLL
jgi:exodeoxyribonuclease VII large subunit